VATGLILVVCGVIALVLTLQSDGSPRSERTILDVEIAKQRVAHPRRGMANVHSEAWKRVSVGPSDRDIDVFFIGGLEPCNFVDHVAAQESPKSIALTLFVGNDPRTTQFCPAIGFERVVHVKLHDNVAGRPIVDGATSATSSAGG